MAFTRTIQPYDKKSSNNMSAWTDYAKMYDGNTATYGTKINSTIWLELDLSSLPTNIVITSITTRVLFYRTGGTTNKISYTYGYSAGRGSAKATTDVLNGAFPLTTQQNAIEEQTQTINLTETQSDTILTHDNHYISLQSTDGTTSRIYEIYCDIAYRLKGLPVYGGSTSFSSIYTGTTPVNEIYIGNTRVF